LPGPVAPPTGDDVTSLVVYIAHDRVGALLAVLTELAVRGVNLTRIESRPTKGQLGEYCFSIDCEGHLADARIADALTALHRVCSAVRYLGSYPRRDGSQSALPLGARDADYHERVAAAFESLAVNEPERFRRIDALGTADKVTARLIAALEDLL